MYSAKNSCFQNVELIQPWEFRYNIDGVPFKSRGLQALPLAMFCPRDQSLVYSLQWVSPLDQYSPSHLPYLIIVDLSPISHLWIWVLLGHLAFYVFYFDLRGSWHCMKPTRELFFFLISMGIIKSSAKNSKKMVGNFIYNEKSSSFLKISLNKMAFLCPQTGLLRQPTAFFELKWLKGNVFNMHFLTKWSVVLLNEREREK